MYSALYNSSVLNTCYLDKILKSVSLHVYNVSSEETEVCYLIKNNFCKKRNFIRCKMVKASVDMSATNTYYIYKKKTQQFYIFVLFYMGCHTNCGHFRNLASFSIDAILIPNSTINRYLLYLFKLYKYVYTSLSPKSVLYINFFIQGIS